MAAQYPSAVKSFTTKVDFTDTVLAEHVNSLQDEVNSLENNLGTYVATGSGWVGSFDQVTTGWNTLKDRITNIEYGLNTAYNQRVDTAGGSTIQSTSNIVTSLIIKAKSGQSTNILEFQTSAGSVVSKVGTDGVIYTSNKALVPVIYASSQPSSVPAGTIWVDSTSNISQLDASSGLPAGGTTGQILTKSSNSDYAAGWSTTIPISTAVSGLGTGVATALGTNVGSSGAVLVNGGVLGTPSSGTLTNATGLPISTGVSGLGTNVATFLATPSSANLSAAITDETGSGALVFGTSPTITTATISNSIIKSPLEHIETSATAATGTVNIDVKTSGVWYYTSNASANWTFNIRGDGSTTLDSILTTGESVSVAFLVTNGSTAYYPTTIKVDGTTVTPKWQGGITPTGGNASSIDSYGFLVIKTASNTFTVLASQTKFA